MKSAELSLSGVVTGASDDDVHQHHRNALSAALIDPNVVDVDAHSASLHAAVGATHASGTRSGALFDEFYDDWAAFDAAVALAIEQHHPIRKRSSLTFEVYNRTVSKGRHDRKCIAEYLSKTFKCTHGIKFRPRGKGRRERHKLRDTGCPFHVYATVVEFGATYRVKVRQQDQHNHPIGPDALKHMSSLVDADYDLESEHGDAAHEPHEHQTAAAAASATLSAGEIDLDGALSHKSVRGHQHHQHHQHQHHPDNSHHHHHSSSTSGLPDPHVGDESDQSHAGLDHAQAHVLLKAQAIAQAHEILQAQAHVRAHAHEQARMQAAEAQAQALLHAQAHADMLVDAAVHESESLLESAIESTMSGDFGDAPKDAPAHVTPSLEPDDAAAAATEETAAPVVAVDDAPVLPPQQQQEQEADAALVSPPPKFEPTTTLEAIRRKMAAFADERDWNQFHTPRNLLLALTGEVGELCEIFQWRGDSNSNVADWTPEDKEHLGEEMSDVLLYLVRLADQCNVDLAAAVHDKMAKNARKYPAELVRGSSKKYNEYKRRRVSSADAHAPSSLHSTSNEDSSASETALI